MNDLAPAASPLIARLGDDGLARLLPHLDEEAHAPGAVVVREGDTGRDLYLVVRGEARVSRKGLDVGALGPGAHFGEIALVTGAPRAASVVAATALTLARLRPERFESLVREDPALAVALLRGVVDTLGAELTAVTDNLGALLRERTLPRRIEVRVRGDCERTVRTGTALGEVLPTHLQGARVVAGLLDHRPVSLVTPITSDAEVRALTDDRWEGQRVLDESAGLLALEAIARVLPECAARLGPSLHGAQRVDLEGLHLTDALLADVAAEITAALRALVDADAPVREEIWALDEAVDHLARQGWSDAVAQLRASREATVTLVSCGVLYSPRHGPLVPRTGMLQGLHVTAAHGALTLRRGDDRPRGAPPRGPPTRWPGSTSAGSSPWAWPRRGRLQRRVRDGPRGVSCAWPRAFTRSASGTSPTPSRRASRAPGWSASRARRRRARPPSSSASRCSSR
jgi:CRP-like cAMP-binding protein